MMDFFDEINGLKYLFFVKLSEPEDNRLSIIVKEATVSKRAADVIIGNKNIGSAKRINYNGSGNKYEIYFNTYAAYSIIDESFYMFKDNQERLGRLLCIYSKSNYIEYIRMNTIVEHIREGELKHYAINCLNHIIDIITIDEPVIKKL